jgi:opacity protein-like surface antigen
MKLLIATIVTAIATMFTTVALASEAGPYVSVGAGVFQVHDSEVSASDSYRISYDTGYSVNGAVGYDFGVNVRTELEVAYRHADTNTLQFFDGNHHYLSDISLVSLLANLFYDVKLPHGFTPYVGGGLGVAFVDMKPGNFNVVFTSGFSHPTTNANAHSSDTVLAYQVGCGIAYAVTPKISLDAGYRYFATDDVAVNTFLPGKLEFASHIGQVGIRYQF